MLYAFTGAADGGEPSAPLFRDPAGNLYGTTVVGGDPKCTCGTIFKLDTSNVLTVLHTFKGGIDGARPISGILSVSGTLYGTTQFGGTGCADFQGCGVLFKLTAGGNYDVLHRFDGITDGSDPRGLIRDPAGNIYGVANSDTAEGNQGTIFELDTTGAFTLLYTFPGGSPGAGPTGRLTRDANGVFHGATLSGGDATCDCGVVFRLDAAGNESVVHTFFGGGGGGEPSGIVDDGERCSAEAVSAATSLATPA